MKNFYFSKLILFLIIITQASFGAIQLSSEAEISVLTCKPGEELYSTFGHNAIRINDPSNHFDKVYNYGIFDFNSPNFYTNFVLGKLNYRLAVSNYSRYIQEYIYDDRTIIEQTLNLPQDVKQSLFDLLSINYLPENRYYLYDFFYDNCSTRLRDVIEKATNGRLLKAQSDELTSVSFRDALKPYLLDRQWLNFGMDLILGLPADKIMTRREFTFLPDIVKSSFLNTVWNDSEESFVSKTDVIYQSSRKLNLEKYYFSPQMILWILTLIFGIIIWFSHKNSKVKFELSILMISGLLGILFLFLWFCTDHKSMGMNLNVVWALPTHFPVIVFYKLLSDKFKKYYFFVTGFVLVMFLLLHSFIPQGFPVAIAPVVLILIVSSFSVFLKIRER